MRSNGLPRLLGKLGIGQAFIRNLKQLMISLTKEYFKVRVVWPASGLQDDLGEKDGCSLKNGVGSSVKYHLNLKRRQKSLKSLRNSGSFNFLCIGAKSRPFFRTFISVSVRTFLLRLSTVSDTKLPDNLHCSVRTDGTLI